MSDETVTSAIEDNQKIYSCPNCNESDLRTQATIECSLEKDGSLDWIGSKPKVDLKEWVDTRCCACGFEGTIQQFQPQAPRPVRKNLWPGRKR